MKIIKNRLFIFILGGIVFSAITVVAVTSITADQIQYDSNTTVKDKIDDLYTVANKPILSSLTVRLRSDGWRSDVESQALLPLADYDYYKYFKVDSIVGEGTKTCRMQGYNHGNLDISTNTEYHIGVEYNWLFVYSSSTANGAQGMCTATITFYNK